MYPPFCFVSIIYFKLHSYVVIMMKDEIFCFHMQEGVRDLNDFSLYVEEIKAEKSINLPQVTDDDNVRKVIKISLMTLWSR
jgi:hypothetical protein